MLPIIEQLVRLQEQDRNLQQLKQEIKRTQEERGQRNALLAQLDGEKEELKHQSQVNESARKDLELEVQAKKQLIDKYSIQQFQTKKNDEYQALGKEIDRAKQSIIGLEDRQLELMEEGERLRVLLTEKNRELGEKKSALQQQVQEFQQKEAEYLGQVSEQEAERERLAGAVDAKTLGMYERILSKKGASVVVPVKEDVCGGCHMKLPIHLVLAVQSPKELVMCSNCGRLLY